MYRYAHLNSENRVISVSTLSAEVEHDSLIPLSPDDIVQIGYIYRPETGEWEASEFPQPEPSPTKLPLEAKVDWLMAELAAVKSTAESETTALQLALAEAVGQQLIDQTATQVGLAELAQAQADDTDTLQLAVAEVATLVTGGDM